MPKKAKKGKKKADDLAEPEHDASWEKAVESGVWERPVTALPDANTWPTWGALRERVLTACKEIRVVSSPSLRDAFCAEIVKLSPPELHTMDVRGSVYLRKVIISPMAACPKLDVLNLSLCDSLEYVLIQSQSLRSLDLSKCGGLQKVLIHCPKLQKIFITNCTNLDTIMIWSDELTELDLSGCNNISNLKLHCSALMDTKVPPLKPAPRPVKPSHPPIGAMLRDNYKEAAQVAADAREKEWRSLKDDSIICSVFRPF